MTRSATQLSARIPLVWERLAWGLADVRQRLVQAGLWPAPSVTVQTPGGPVQAVRGAQVLPAAGGADVKGLLMPAATSLWGTLHLPDMPRAALGTAVQEAMWRVSPLPPEQMVSAWCAAPEAQGGWRVDWGLCPQQVRAQGLAQLGLPEDAPVYLLRAEDGQAYLTQGPAAQRLASRQKRWDAAVLALGLLLLAALALPVLMPLVLKRQAVVRAVQHVQTVEPMAAPLREKLDALRHQAEAAAQVRQDQASSLPLAMVLERLTQALPDDTWLDRLEINGQQIRLVGLTGNAAELSARLSRHPNLTEVRATAPTVRDESQKKERFSFEMRWREPGQAS